MVAVGKGDHPWRWQLAVAINDAGQSVGFSPIAGGGTELVLWSPSGKATNLSAVLGPAWAVVRLGLNNSGDVFGYGLYHGGVYGFLLTPVSASPLSAVAAPELSIWTMLVVGFAGLSVASYCRGRNGRAARVRLRLLSAAQP